jgi:hypothetical protein
MTSLLLRFRLLAGFGERGRVEVSPRVPVYRRVEKTAPFLRKCSSIPLVEVLMLSASPTRAKSLKWKPQTDQFPTNYSPNINSSIPN